MHLLFRLFVKLASTGDLNKSRSYYYIAATKWSHNRRNSKGSRCNSLESQLTNLALELHSPLLSLHRLSPWVFKMKRSMVFYGGTEPNLAIWNRNKRFSPIYGMVLLGPLSLCSSHSQSFLKNLSVASVLHSGKTYKSYLNLASYSSAFA